MGKEIYTAEAQVTGGRLDGRGRGATGNLDVTIKPPKELGGDGDGTNPEELFAVGYAACFESAMGTVARRLKLEGVDPTIDSKVSLVTNEDRGFDLAVELDVSLPGFEDREQAASLIRKAHRVCPYSNATRGNIDVKITLDGESVEKDA
jgi:osmotically inducible protein OsmC